jgi:hypothetical protein
MSKMKRVMNGAKFPLRAIASTIVGESADSAIFITIAFFSILSFRQLVMMILTQAFLKTMYEIVILPLTQRVVIYIKRKENIDIIDRGISYSIWKIRDVG